jgi:hypothetical protein
MFEIRLPGLNVAPDGYDKRLRVMQNHSLPTAGRAVSAITLSLLIALAAAVQTVESAGSAVGTMAALPLALLVFIVLAAISLVLTARLDERWNR